MDDSPTLDRPRSRRGTPAGERPAARAAVAEGRLDERGAAAADPARRHRPLRLGRRRGRRRPSPTSSTSAGPTSTASCRSTPTSARPRRRPHRVALCRGEACQAVGAQLLYARRGGGSRATRTSRSARSSASATAPSGRPGRSTARCVGRLSRTGSTSSPRSGPDDDRCGCPATRPPSRSGADDVARALVRRRGRDRPAATAPAGCCGSSRSSRSRPTAGRVGYAKVQARTSRTSSRGACSTGRAAGTRVGVVDETTRGWPASAGSPSPGSGVTEPADVAGYVAGGGLAGPASGRSRLAPPTVVREVTTSGLRGRGGAGFATGRKWETVRTPRRPRRGSSSPTPTRATAAPSRTGCSSRATRSPSSRGWPSPGTPSAPTRVTSISAASTRTPSRRCAGPSTAARGRAGWARTSWAAGSRFDLAGPGRRRGLHLRRGDLDAREPRGPARRGPGQAADPRPRGPVRACRRSSTTSSPSPACR